MVDYFYYGFGFFGLEVEYYCVNGVDYVWLMVGNDINYIIELWKFFNKYQGIVLLGLQENEFEFIVYFNFVMEVILFSGLFGKNVVVKLVDVGGKIVMMVMIDFGMIKFDRNQVMLGNY